MSFFEQMHLTSHAEVATHMKHNQPEYAENVELLNQHLRQYPFHDHPIESLRAINKRLLIQMDHVTLIITGVSEFKKARSVREFESEAEEDLLWKYETVTASGLQFKIEIETHAGLMTIIGRHLRLVRNSDMAILIPAIDR